MKPKVLIVFFLTLTLFISGIVSTLRLAPLAKATRAEVGIQPLEADWDSAEMAFLYRSQSDLVAAEEDHIDLDYPKGDNRATKFGGQGYSGDRKHSCGEDNSWRILFPQTWGKPGVVDKSKWSIE